MLFVPDPPVVVLAHPELSGPTEDGIRLPGGEYLPRLDDLSEWETFELLHQNVDVIGHHTPLPELIALPVEADESFAHQSGDLRAPQVALAPAGVFILCYSTEEFLMASFLRPQHLAQVDFFPPAIDGGSRNAVREAERQALGDVRSVEMRQIAPRIDGTMFRPVQVALRPGRGRGERPAVAHPRRDSWP